MTKDILIQEVSKFLVSSWMLFLFKLEKMELKMNLYKNLMRIVDFTYAKENSGYLEEKVSELQNNFNVLYSTDIEVKWI